MKIEKTIVTITADHDSTNARHARVETINEIKDGAEIYAISHNNYIELDGVEYINGTEELPKGYETIEAVGYSQGDRIAFYIVNGNEGIKKHMSRLYTHKNDYICTAREQTEDGREKEIELEISHMTVDYSEFPTQYELIKAFQENNKIDGTIGRERNI